MYLQIKYLLAKSYVFEVKLFLLVIKINKYDTITKKKNIKSKAG